MQFTSAFHIYPRAGRIPTVAGFLETMVRARQAGGRRVALHQTVAGDEGPMLTVTGIWNSLEEYQRLFVEGAPYPGIGEMLADNSGRTAWSELRRTIIEPPPGGPPAAFVERRRITAAPGKEAQLTDLLVARVTARNAAGSRQTLAAKITGTLGVLISTTFFASLAEYEAGLEAALGDTARNAFIEKVGALVTPPGSTELMRTIVPMNP